MRPVSILNDVLGPVMRGPSSSHTAGCFRIGRLARDLLGGDPTSVRFSFDPGGSLAEVYRQQGSDLAFAAGVLGGSIVDDGFLSVLDLAAERGVDLTFAVEPLAEAEHPNSVEIRMTAADGERLEVRAESVGGGAIVVRRVGPWPVELMGDAHEMLVALEPDAEPAVRECLSADGHLLEEPRLVVEGDRALLMVRRAVPMPGEVRAALEELQGVRRVRTASPVLHVQSGEPLFSSASAMVGVAREKGLSLGQVGLIYESALLDVPEESVLAEVMQRLEIMRASVEQGLEHNPPPMQLLAPSAGRIYEAEAQGRVAAGGAHTRAAARAMAVMHVNGGMGVICAAPTAGSAGVIPGTVITMVDEWGLDQEEAALSLLAGGAIGLVIGSRATFAAEVAGCQVEIGAAGAMAAAAVVEVAGGEPQQAIDAAAIALQNNMGSVCDMVQGIVEIPCHTRNAVASSSAFVCADLVLGGYLNPIPLDETVDAVLATGCMLPRELKCTALGGLAATPSGQALPRLR